MFLLKVWAAKPGQQLVLPDEKLIKENSELFLLSFQGKNNNMALVMFITTLVKCIQSANSVLHWFA